MVRPRRSILRPTAHLTPIIQSSRIPRRRSTELPHPHMDSSPATLTDSPRMDRSSRRNPTRHTDSLTANQPARNRLPPTANLRMASPMAIPTVSPMAHTAKCRHLQRLPRVRSRHRHQRGSAEQALLRMLLPGGIPAFLEEVRGVQGPRIPQRILVVDAGQLCHSSRAVNPRGCLQ